jgi:hypothetical protein
MDKGQQTTQSQLQLSQLQVCQQLLEAVEVYIYKILEIHKSQLLLVLLIQQLLMRMVALYMRSRILLQCLSVH